MEQSNENESEHHETKIFTNIHIFTYGESKYHMLMVHFIAEIWFYIFGELTRCAPSCTHPAPRDEVNTAVS